MQVRAYGAVENLHKNRAACTRPTAMHAKTLVSSETYSVSGMGFYLAVLLSFLPASPSLPHIPLQTTPRCAIVRIPSWPVSFTGTGDKEAA